jgi:hypothetical protein
MNDQHEQIQCVQQRNHPFREFNEMVSNHRQSFRIIAHNAENML